MADGSLFGRLDRPLVIDLFAGIGGTSAGVELAGLQVEAAVNHWPYAIQMHAKNHPGTRHFLEDVFEVEPWVAARGRSPDLLVGSPDCTHFSVAKGGAPRDTGRRALADVFVKWAAQVRPRVIILENVREFTTWGPLDEAGQPMPERKGEHFRAWVAALEGLGYRVEWQLLRACDYGAPTARLRLFVVARCDNRPIRWPAPTHGDGLVPHRTAAECIDWSIPCRSIFDRKKPLAEATMRRIAAAQDRYGSRCLVKYYGAGEGQAQPVDRPLDTITCKARFGLVADGGFRMLEPRELARAQGFPDSYVLEGSKADQIAGIGNSVVPQVMAALVRANF